MCSVGYEYPIECNWLVPSPCLLKKIDEKSSAVAALVARSLPKFWDLGHILMSANLSTQKKVGLSQMRSLAPRENSISQRARTCRFRTICQAGWHRSRGVTCGARDEC